MSATKPYTPSPVVELAFVDRTSVPGLSDWIEASDDCFQARTTRGRTSEFDNFNAGTLTLGLYNDDRKYDPLYASNVSDDLEAGSAIAKVLAEFDSAITLYSDAFTSAIASFWEDPNNASGAGFHISSNKLVGLGGFFLRTRAFEASRSVSTVEMVVAGNGTDPVYFGLCSESSTTHGAGLAYARFRRSSTNLVMESVAGGATATTSVTYNSTTHRWLRVQVTGTSIIYSTSPDNVTWTVRATHTDATVLANLPATLKAFIEDSWSTGTHSEWDNFSVTTTRLPVWYGSVESMSIEYEEGGKGSKVTLNGVDAIDYLSDYVFPNTVQGWVADFFGANDVKDWFPFDKVAKTGRGFEEERFPNIGSSSNPEFQQKVKLEIGEPIHPSSLGSLKVPAFTPELDGRSYAAFRGFSDASFINYTNTATIAMWLQFEDPGTFQTILAGFHDLFFANSSGPTGGVSWSVRVQANLGAPGGVSAGGGAVIEADALAIDPASGLAYGLGYDLFDGKPHHVVFVRDGTTGTTYFDGAAVATDTESGATTHGDTRFEAIGLTPTGATGDVQSASFRISDLMIWHSYDLTASEVLSLYERMRDGWINVVTTGAAINALLDEMGWPRDFRSIDDGTALVQLPKELEGQNALALMQKIAETEQGRLFVDELGCVVFQDRARQFTNTLETTVQYSFTDVDRDTTPSDVGIVDESLSLALDDEFKITRAEVSRVGGTTQIAETGNGRYTREVKDLLFTSDALALSMAEWLVFRYSASEVRADAWSVSPETFTDDWVPILQLGIGTRVELEFTPNGIGSASNLQMILGLVDHEIDDEEWTVKFHGTPADNNTYFTWLTEPDTGHGWNEGVWA